MNLINYMTVIVSAFLLTACMDDTQEAPNPNVMTNCGIIGYTESTESFSFHCNLSEQGLELVKDMSNFNLDKNQTCEVYFGSNGQPSRFSCHKEAVDVSSYLDANNLYDAEWSCEGLYGDKSIYRFKNDGNFEIDMPREPESDSVWYIQDSLISGRYKYDSKNTITLQPDSWVNEVVKVSGIKFEEAPSYLRSPITFEILNINTDSFSGYEIKSNRSYSFSCKKVEHE